MVSITLEHISKSFGPEDGAADGRVPALRDVSLKVGEGQVLAILGPSGCGKSTLLRIAAGLIKPDSGHVYYDQTNLQDVPLMERGIGMVFQDRALVPHWVARKSVGFFLSIRKREEEVPEKLRQIAKITGIGLDVLLERKPGELSGGEQQRVSIARALSRDLKVLFFDEPFANLDAKYRTEARVELRRLMNAFPVTSIYVTHDQVEAVALSHRIAVMREGHLEQSGTYQDLRDNPINTFIATFIGTPIMNLFPGHADDGIWQGENFGPFPIRRDLPAHHPVTMGIRPEYVSLGEDGVYGVVEEATPFYAERHHLITVHLAGERWSLVTPLDQPVEWGATIRCQLDPERLLYFDTATGQRIG
jgi:ABC-type sugar transport system ATPase subunit